MLIDSGSSNNFIDQWMVNKLEIAFTAVQGFEVMVANGKKLYVTNMCKGLLLESQGFKHSTDF